MFEASQTFPFPGKRSLRADASRKESESLGATHESVRLKIVLRVKELYYDLLLATEISTSSGSGRHWRSGSRRRPWPAMPQDRQGGRRS